VLTGNTLEFLLIVLLGAIAGWLAAAIISTIFGARNANRVNRLT